MGIVPFKELECKDKILKLERPTNVIVGAKDKEGAEDGAIDDKIVGYADGVLIGELDGELDDALEGTVDSLGELDRLEVSPQK